MNPSLNNETRSKVPNYLTTDMIDRSQFQAIFRPSIWLLAGISLTVIDTVVAYITHGELHFIAGLTACIFCVAFIILLRQSGALEMARKELKRSDEKLIEAQLLVRIGGWEIGNQGAVILSPEAAEIFGIYDQSKFSGKIRDFYALVHPEDRARLREATKNALQNSERFTASYRVVLEDGRIRYLRDSAIVLRNELGEPLGLNGVVQDISEGVEIDRKIQLAEQMEKVGMLAGGMAHDFGNTLAIILGSAELMKYRKEYDSQTVENIIEAADQGTKVVQRLLGYARQTPLITVCLCLDEAVGRCVERLRGVIGGSAHLDYTRPINPTTIVVDKDQLSDALFNVVFNARDASGPDCLIKIECGAASDIDLTGFTLPDGELCNYGVIIVSDQGNGMTADELEKATQPFFTTKTGSGNGLGLAMVASFIDQAKGQLSILSKRGEGTRVAMFFPTS